MTSPNLPTVHLNGTSRQELISQRKDACRALYQAIQTLQAMAPNGRDYYMVEGSFAKALEQHVSRLETVTAIYEAITAEVLALDEI